VTRFWSAKEAVAKAEGTGLEGRPTAFVITTAQGETFSVTCTQTAREYLVEMRVVAGPATSEDEPTSYVVAWTHAPLHQPATPVRRNESCKPTATT
jgi:phosphopantetheinyl transferase